VAESVGREVADDGYVPAICGLSRASQSDVEAAWNAVSNAIRPRIHTFIATSKVHMESKLKKTPQQVIEYATNAVRHARSLGCEDVEFSAEDSGRSEPEFLREILAAVIDAGATTLNIPDTVGWCLPHEFGNLIETLRSDVAGSESVLWSVHCQNDLGLATANSIAGALGGARQIECTINGIGERAGNASLEEVALSLLLRGHSSAGNGLWCGIEPKHIASTSSMVSEFTGMSVQPHKAIVGANAFAHESGIHQDGMLKNRSTYEIVDPAVVGITRRSSDPGLVLGKHSGRHAVRSKLDELGYELSEDEVDGVFERFKDVAQHRSGGISDEDISALVHDSVYQPSAVWELVELTVTCGTMSLPVACVQLKGPDGLHRCATASGTGPVDAAYKAVDEVVRTTAQLTEYNISAVTEGIEALATTRVTIRPMDDTTRYSASGSSADVVRASVRAYVSALNKLITRTASEAARSDEGVSASNDNVSNSESSSNFAAATASTNNRQRE
jgi:2-isopropylmalate synthase